MEDAVQTSWTGGHSEIKDSFEALVDPENTLHNLASSCHAQIARLVRKAKTRRRLRIFRTRNTSRMGSLSLMRREQPRSCMEVEPKARNRRFLISLGDGRSLPYLNPALDHPIQIESMTEMQSHVRSAQLAVSSGA